jgi:hypothetical protein
MAGIVFASYKKIPNPRTRVPLPPSPQPPPVAPTRPLPLPPQIYRTWRRAGRAPPIPPRSCSLQPARGIPSCLSHQLEPSAASACRGSEGRKEDIHRSISRIQSKVRKKGLHLPLEIQIVSECSLLLPCKQS